MEMRLAQAEFRFSVPSVYSVVKKQVATTLYSNSLCDAEI